MAMSMAMARTYFLKCPNLLTPLTSTSPTKYHFSFHTSSLSFIYNHKKDERHLPFLALASSTIPAVINVDYLEKEFNNNGVSYTSIGDSCAVKIGLENGSIATLLLPSGLITSYKAHMWHGSTMEILHTTVSEEEDGSPLIQGGVYVDFKCESEDGYSWSPRTWTIFDVRGSPEEIIQVELISRDLDGMVEAKYIVTLHPDLLTSELVITSSKDTSLELFGSILSHLTVSSPDATYAIGLEGSTFCNKPPFMSSYSIVPPDFSQSESGQSWGESVLQGLSFSTWGGKDTNNDAVIESRNVEMEEEMEEEEDDNDAQLTEKMCRIYTYAPMHLEEEDDNDAQLTEKMCRIYTYAPRRFTIIDRGRRNSVVVGRNGFDEQYIFSPGSRYDLYGKYAYICTGPSAMRKPIVLGPKSVWRGEQSLYNPNL